MRKILMILFLSLILGACQSNQGDQSTGAESPQTQHDENTVTSEKEELTIKLGAQPTSGQVFQFIADKHGFNKEEGINVEMVYLSNLSDASSALNAGQVDVLSTYGTGGPLIQIANGQDYTIFGGYMIIGETPLYGKVETEYNDLHSLEGKKIGITRGGTPDIVLKGILNDAGIPFTFGETIVGDADDPRMITFIEYKKNPDVLQAILKNEVDFGATATGYQIQARDLGLEVKMWPDELWENHSCCRLFGMSKFVNENEEALYRLFRSYLRAEEYMTENMQEVSDLVVENLDITQETADSFVLSEHMKYDTDPYNDSVVAMWNKMSNFGYLDQGDVKIEDHLNDNIYERALNSLIEDYPESEFFKAKLTQYQQNNNVLN